MRSSRRWGKVSSDSDVDSKGRIVGFDWERPIMSHPFLDVFGVRNPGLWVDYLSQWNEFESLEFATESWKLAPPLNRFSLHTSRGAFPRKACLVIGEQLTYWTLKDCATDVVRSFMCAVHPTLSKYRLCSRCYAWPRFLQVWRLFRWWRRSCGSKSQSESVVVELHCFLDNRLDSPDFSCFWAPCFFANSGPSNSQRTGLLNRRVKTAV